MVPNVGYYVQSVDRMVKETEKIGEKMHPKYQVIREAIDQKKTAEITAEELAEIICLFEEGTKKYHTIMKKISRLRPPAKVMGIHKTFEKAYLSYIDGCEEMIQSLQSTAGIDSALFDASEEKQDRATDNISASIQKMTKVLLKNK
ncbi:hypothetical protein [Enterococcus ratti]|uniref:hypothetical protein n=1 Tax=Enterococcus ratti TaxID=150033 RepID=UPI0008FFF261|nr:hypothetical protein [Enterococcus ratti]